MKNIKGVFRNLERLLSNAKWFGDDWHIYNRGEYLQLYKGSWHNDNQGGVHFETFIRRVRFDRRRSRFASTRKKTAPARFIQELVALEGKRMQTWKGRCRAGLQHLRADATAGYQELEQRLFEGSPGSAHSKLESKRR